MKKIALKISTNYLFPYFPFSKRSASILIK